MRPVMLHADGTDCFHDGTPRATMLEESGPLCPGGLPVTHVRFNGNVVTIESAYASLKGMAEAFTKAITPLVASFAEVARKIGNDPAIRALAAAAAVVNDERQREDGPAAH